MQVVRELYQPKIMPEVICGMQNQKLRDERQWQTWCTGAV